MSKFREHLSSAIRVWGMGVDVRIVTLIFPEKILVNKLAETPERMVQLRKPSMPCAQGSITR